MPEAQPPQIHIDSALFAEALNYTAATTGFSARLIEKDYYCTLLLDYLAAVAPGLVFKGGTCLAKVHADFYRLSEDLDFSIPIKVSASRQDRRKLAAAVKAAVAKVAESCPGLRCEALLAGSNDSSQYGGRIAYSSALDTHPESLRIEIGLREPLLTAPFNGPLRTLLLNPISGEPLLVPFPVCCLSFIEAMAEKLRAALSRREAAIRDFYDIDYAIQRKGFKLEESPVLSLTREKLAVPGNDPLDVTPARLDRLRAQLHAQLRPVLRERDFGAFDLERAIAAVRGVAAALERSRP